MSKVSGNGSNSVSGIWLKVWPSSLLPSDFQSLPEQQESREVNWSQESTVMNTGLLSGQFRGGCEQQERLPSFTRPSTFRRTSTTGIHLWQRQSLPRLHAFGSHGYKVISSDAIGILHPPDRAALCLLCFTGNSPWSRVGLGLLVSRWDLLPLFSVHGLGPCHSDRPPSHGGGWS